MSQDIRWLQRFENLEKALERLNEAIAAESKEPKNHLYQIAVIGSYQFTYELCWKTLKDFLKYNGVDASLPREVIKQAFHHNLISDGMLWIEMLEERNIMAHVYQDAAASKALDNIKKRYIVAILELYNFLKSKR
jgi:nucleotidyltransferase substrate binding protein (TIGR01987 family)